MTDLRKAAEMALDAMLSEYSTSGENKYSPWDVIEALHQALAQPEQEPVCDKDPYYCGYVRCQLGKVCKNTAPPKREWVGLTDGEVASFENAGVWGEKDIRAIEAKLKEKNGG